MRFLLEEALLPVMFGDAAFDQDVEDDVLEGGPSPKSRGEATDVIDILTHKNESPVGPTLEKIGFSELVLVRMSWSPF